jgi:hypothetical protein
MKPSWTTCMIAVALVVLAQAGAKEVSPGAPVNASAVLHPHTMQQRAALPRRYNPRTRTYGDAGAAVLVI